MNYETLFEHGKQNNFHQEEHYQGLKRETVYFELETAKGKSALITHTYNIHTHTYVCT